ncbi:MAG TPA: EAL domain-containing protein, partial [Thermoanaerobaculia bacterium]|nr:EAL domain-containing protein [Thermoanaerobaculia bacterium]
GTPGPDTEAEAVRLGAAGYLLKPVSSGDLVRAVSHSTRLCRLARLVRSAPFSPRERETLPASWPTLPAAFARALGSLYLAWQPVVHACDGTVYGNEGYARTLEPSLSQPGSLFEAGERLDRVRELGRRVRRAAAFDRDQLGPGALFVNLHARELLDDDLYDAVAPLANAATSVVLDIAGHDSLVEVPRLGERIRRLRGLGYRIAVDDLGAGQAGLSCLAALAPDIAKLDVALLEGLDHDVARQERVGAMTRACHDLGILVVAEGIENPGQRDAAASLGVDLLQGFLFGRPRPVLSDPGAAKGEPVRSAGRGCEGPLRADGLESGLDRRPCGVPAHSR